MRITEVKKRLISKGWTQKAIAKAARRSKSEVSMILNGQRFSRSVQEDIAQAVGLSVEELFGEWAWFKRPKRGVERDDEHPKL